MALRVHSFGSRSTFLLLLIGLVVAIVNIRQLLRDVPEGMETTENERSFEGTFKNSTYEKCPMYFKFIKDDLQPWRDIGGIDKKSILIAKREASFRIQIFDGQLFVQHYKWCYQTRALFSIWGLLQLLRRFYPHYSSSIIYFLFLLCSLSVYRHPGQVPNVDLMFHCMDSPLVKKSRFGNHSYPPILMKYCSSKENMDIVWPDWSFWGWPEVRIDDWDTTCRKIRNASGAITWEKRIPLGQWKGAVWVAPHIRQPVVSCNDHPFHRWKVQTSDKNWVKEVDNESSRLENQCNYRYKIYVEGTSWSCSLKYMMACNSTMLQVRPKYHDFFSRSLMADYHFLDIPSPEEEPVCEAFKKTIEWAEMNQSAAKQIADASLRFVTEDLAMERVYDYMLHFLIEYAKLLNFKPSKVNTTVLTTIESAYSEAPDFAKPFLKKYNASSQKIPICSLE